MNFWVIISVVCQLNANGLPDGCISSVASAQPHKTRQDCELALRKTYAGGGQCVTPDLILKVAGIKQ